VFVVTLRRQRVPRGSRARLWGYLAVLCAPLLASALLAMPIRFFAVQPFRIPSGAMQPTLQVGDYVLVSKGAYGYSRFSLAPFVMGPPGRVFAKPPKRGDIVVFRPTNAPDKDFVKRIVGLPGDKVQLQRGVLYINGAAAPRQSLGARVHVEASGETITVEAFAETLPGGVSYTVFDRGADMQGDSTELYTVPADHFFMLGDDRDNSSDSRLEMAGFGPVPFDHLIGRVDRIVPAR
jgi:signal peptidase I